MPPVALPEEKIPVPISAPTLILFMIVFLLYILSRMKNPIMTTNDMGNGNIIEIPKLIANHIPNHTNWRISVLISSSLPVLLSTPV